MKNETEITVKVNCSYDKLHDDLTKQGFKLTNKYNMIDYYMINESIDIENMETVDILNKCIRVRDIPGVTKALLYKYKEYDEKGDLIKDNKLNCEVENINDAINFMKIIGYKVLFEIKDEMDVYSNNVFEIIVQKVNNYIFIEMEDEGRNIDYKFESIDDIKKAFSRLNIDYDKSNYFVSKAQIILKETLEKE